MNSKQANKMIQRLQAGDTEGLEALLSEYGRAAQARRLVFLAAYGLTCALLGALATVVPV